MNYHFNKNFIPRESLEEQLKRVFEKLKQRESEQWVDTVPYGSEATAYDDLAEVKKMERKNVKL